MSEEPNDPPREDDESTEVDDGTTDAGGEAGSSSTPNDREETEESEEPPAYDDIPDHLKADTAPDHIEGAQTDSDTESEGVGEGDESGTAEMTEATKSFDDNTHPTDENSETDVEPEENAESELDEGDLRDGLPSSSSTGFADVDVSRRGFLLGAAGATLGVFSGGFLGGALYEKARLAKERRDLKQKYQQMEQDLAERREQLQVEYTTPTTEDEVALEVDESVTVPLRNFRHFPLKFEKETLLTYEVEADDHIDIMVLQADQFADYRSKKSFRIRDQHSEMDTSVTTISEVIPPGWYFLVLDHSEAGVAKPDPKTDGDVKADVSLKAYQQSDSGGASANNSSN